MNQLQCTADYAYGSDVLVFVLQCTPDYAYGTGGFPAWGIQPNSVLIFEIEVLSAK